MPKEKTPPTLFIVFNRLEKTKRVFATIRKSKPERLYISCDGPRKNIQGEAKKVSEIRSYLLEHIDWDCEVETLFHDVNQGCKYAPQLAISWLFDHEEKGIILEDDCVPTECFFRFTSELLDRYEDDFRVFGISGINFQSDKFELKDSYYLSRFFMTWGWATWKSRWQKHIKIQDNFELYLEDPSIHNLIDHKIANQTLVSFARKGYLDELDAWDYQWILSCMINNGLIATPTKNLIQNIGFGSDATHTTSSLNRRCLAENIEFPLVHPNIMVNNKEIDKSFYNNVNGWLSTREKIVHIPYLKAAINSKIKSFLQKRFHSKHTPFNDN